MSEDKLPQRTIRTTFWVALWFALIFALRGQPTVSFGLLLGSAIGLFSLWSLTVAVPRLFTPGNAGGAKFLLGGLMLLKLPLYALILNFAMVSPYISPFAVFVGVAFVPGVLVLKVMANQSALNVKTSPGEGTCRKETTLSS